MAGWEVVLQHGAGGALVPWSCLEGPSRRLALVTWPGTCSANWGLQRCLHTALASSPWRPGWSCPFASVPRAPWHPLWGCSALGCPWQRPCLLFVTWPVTSAQGGVWDVRAEPSCEDVCAPTLTSAFHVTCSRCVGSGGGGGPPGPTSTDAAVAGVAGTGVCHLV